MDTGHTERPSAEELAADESVSVTREEGLYVVTDGDTGISSQGGSEDEALENLAAALATYEEGAAAGDDDWF